MSDQSEQAGLDAVSGETHSQTSSHSKPPDLTLSVRTFLTRDPPSRTASSAARPLLQQAGPHSPQPAGAGPALQRKRMRQGDDMPPVRGSWAPEAAAARGKLAAAVSSVRRASAGSLEKLKKESLFTHPYPDLSHHLSFLWIEPDEYREPGSEEITPLPLICLGDNTITTYRGITGTRTVADGIISIARRRFRSNTLHVYSAMTAGDRRIMAAFLTDATSGRCTIAFHAEIPARGTGTAPSLPAKQAKSRIPPPVSAPFCDQAPADEIHDLFTDLVDTGAIGSKAASGIDLDAFMAAYKKYSKYTPNKVGQQVIKLGREEVMGSGQAPQIRLTENSKAKVKYKLFDSSRHGKILEVEKARIVLGALNVDLLLYQLGEDAAPIADMGRTLGSAVAQLYMDAGISVWTRLVEQIPGVPLEEGTVILDNGGALRGIQSPPHN
ncbi:hypothetical protein [Streptomyces sp. NPDC055085]